MSIVGKAVSDRKTGRRGFVDWFGLVLDLCIGVLAERCCCRFPIVIGAEIFEGREWLVCGFLEDGEYGCFRRSRSFAVDRLIGIGEWVVLEVIGCGIRG